MNATIDSFSQSNKRAFRNPWVIGWIVLILVVLGVNITFITLAVVTNPGLVDKDYYEKGRQYEQTVHEQIAARNALKWTAQLDVPALDRSHPDVIRLAVVDEQGMPISNLKLALASYRPSDAHADFMSELTEFAPGQYQANVNYTLKGLWELTVTVEHEGRTLELLKRRIDVAE